MIVVSHSSFSSVGIHPTVLPQKFLVLLGWGLVLLYSFDSQLQRGLIGCRNDDETNEGRRMELSSEPWKTKNETTSPIIQPLADEEFSLAKSQSYGFFTDIPNQHWKWLQQQALKLPVSSRNKGYATPWQWYMDHMQPDFICPYMERLGGTEGGPHWVCDPHRLQKGCLIYSIVAEGGDRVMNATWERELHGRRAADGCEIHVFHGGNGTNTTTSDNRIHWHPWHVKISNIQHQHRKADLTLQEVIQRLGHEKRRIDILRITAVDTSSWPTFKDMLAVDLIQQVLIEIDDSHQPDTSEKWKYSALVALDLFAKFPRHQYALFHKDVRSIDDDDDDDDHDGQGHYKAEFSYIKLHRDFWTDPETGEFWKKVSEPKTVFVEAGAPVTPPQRVVVSKAKKKELHLLSFVDPLNLGSIQKGQTTGRERTIPRLLLFTYSNNILKDEHPRNIFNNIRNTIQKYRATWKVDRVPVWFLDDNECQQVIQLVQPDLIKLYWNQRGSWKADICRAAALYLSGGYYFDVDIQVITPYSAATNSNISFVTSYNDRRDHFFQAFWAVSPGHAVVRDSVQRMWTFLENATAAERGRVGGVMGPVLLMDAYKNAAANNATTTSHLLQESWIRLSSPYAHLRQKGTGWGCNYLVHDPATRTPYFYSRFVGIGGQCRN